ncbi:MULTISPECIES: hypothetical protein [Pseudomonas]|uniref:hypothetical protein n=1 Tax=Pseudomonas TaxID=286 RepID=UPI0015E7B3A1
MAEFRQLRNYFDKAPNDGITPAYMAKYRDVRANREIAKAHRVKQKKPHKKLRPLLEVNDVEGAWAPSSGRFRSATLHMDRHTC